ncbi:MAG: hypothetical protein ABSB56_00110 [Nitrososphaerales archaeon]
MRAFLVLLVSLVLLGPGLATVAPHRSAADPCGSYGNCMSSSITYTRANPDDSLYPSDQFTIALSITLGSGSGSCGSGCSESWSSSLSGVTWSYDTSEFTAETSGTSASFTVTGNSTGSFTISVTASFSVTITTCVTSTTTTTTTTEASTVTSCSTSYAQSSVTTTQQVTVIQLELQVAARIVNMTDRATGYVLRNPDGSFYRNDSLCVQWNATFQFSDARKDINVSVLSDPLSSLVLLNSSSTTVSTFAPGDPGIRQGMFCYSVALNAPYQPYNLTLSFEAINWLGMSIAHVVIAVPFAVVQYSPSFTCLTYMDYNSRNSTTYARPFVTLVRYGGNNPGYSYSGDDNTAPIIKGNDTRERAYINNFTFATTGWNTTLRLVNASIGQDLVFQNHSVSISYGYLHNQTEYNNKTYYPMITWKDRVQKYYFMGNFTEFEACVPDEMTYYNLTSSAYSRDFAGNTTQLFNTTYLYEPIQYNGYLMFKFYNADGSPDLSANVTITAQNPSPLNVYLIGRVESAFGNDSSVLKAFEKDLYPSNSRMTLKQLQPNLNGTITYLVNQTNLATLAVSTFPSFNITISSELSGASYQFTSQSPFMTGATTTPCTTAPPPWLTCKEFSYDVPDRLSLFLVNGSALPSLPFDNATAYYLDPLYENLILPLNSTLSVNSTASQGPMDYVNWWAASPVGAIINPDLPITQEPGQLTNLYQFIYGQNSTVFVNTEGGGIGLLPPVSQGNTYQLTFAINPQSGGVTRVWAVDSEGTVLTNMSLYPTTPSITSFSPPGYFGFYTAAIPVVYNGTMTVTLVNAWGAKTTIAGIPVMITVSSQPLLSWNFVILITVILLGIGALASLLGWREARQKEA